MYEFDRSKYFIPENIGHANHSRALRVLRSTFSDIFNKENIISETMLHATWFFPLVQTGEELTMVSVLKNPDQSRNHYPFVAAQLSARSNNTLGTIVEALLYTVDTFDHQEEVKKPKMILIHWSGEPDQNLTNFHLRQIPYESGFQIWKILEPPWIEVESDGAVEKPKVLRDGNLLRIDYEGFPEAGKEGFMTVPLTILKPRII